MTYSDAIRSLNDLGQFGLRFGLETPRRLAELIGNPHERLRFIHVAGTNGKGSTCAFLESIYRTAGLKVGLYTSPHLVSFRERIQVNREWISEADVARLVGELWEQRRTGVPPVSVGGAQKSQKEADRQDACPTFFEFVTILAARYFAEQRCDLVIWETGLGGRLDATNIVTPLASVITNVDLDHEQWLGDTVAKIAAEKAGIIKPGVPVFTAIEHPDALPVLFQAAKRAGSKFFLVTWAQAGREPVADTRLPLSGHHQRMNAALAATVALKLADEIPVTMDQIRTGLAQANWPGRFQIVERDGHPLVLDGAHNPAGAAALVATLKEKFPGARPVFILGTLGDKDWPRILESLAPLASQLWLVHVRSDRSARPDALREACLRAHPGISVRVLPGLADALERAKAEPLVVVAGSLYLIGEALELLDPAHTPAHGEHELNEYHPRPELAARDQP